MAVVGRSNKPKRKRTKETAEQRMRAAEQRLEKEMRVVLMNAQAQGDGVNFSGKVEAKAFSETEEAMPSPRADARMPLSPVAWIKWKIARLRAKNLILKNTARWKLAGILVSDMQNAARAGLVRTAQTQKSIDTLMRKHGLYPDAAGPAD
jgi:hypothetical protein